MTRIAHLSDLHLVEDGYAARGWSGRVRLSLLGLGRPFDPQLHRRRFAQALRGAHEARADHLVISGDLTEDGVPEQFEVLAEVLSESPWRPEDVTLVPGNHDAYVRADAYEEALRGPLRPWAATSRPGAVTVRSGVVVVAVSSAVHQPYVRACGRVGREQLERVEAVLEATRGLDVAVLLALHHPPVPWGLRLSWLEGLLDRGPLVQLLQANPQAHVLCGHVHSASDFVVERDRRARVFVAPAVVDHAHPLRLYEAAGEVIWSVDHRLSTPLGSPVTAVVQASVASA